MAQPASPGTEEMGSWGSLYVFDLAFTFEMDTDVSENTVSQLECRF